MKHVFVDNYRGFQNSLIPIEKVNFLVGENSTGKTSILGLLKLLSSPELWFQREFDPKSIGLGTFADIVSASSIDKSCFTIGTAYYGLINKPRSRRKSVKKKSSKNTDKDKETKEFISIVMTFVEDNGVPKLSSFVSIKNNYEVRLKFSKNVIRFKRSKITIDGCETSSKLLAKFESLKNLAKCDKGGYKVVKNSSYLMNAPPLMIVTLIENSLNDESGNFSPLDSFEMHSIFGDMAWIAPIRTKPRKTYDEFSLDFSPEGDHTPYLIRKKLDSKSESKEFVDFIERLGKKSGLFKSIKIKKYGRGSTSPFELDVVLNNSALSINSVGYGVSQALPVIVEIFARRHGSWFAIQQPEVHLHPKAQAALGEIIFELAVADNKQFIIETHSDYLIDRYRLSTRKSKSSVKSQILYFERNAQGNKAHAIEIDERGNISADQPSGYREFFLREEMSLLGI